MRRLTDRQRQIRGYIEEVIEREGQAPSVDEIRRHFGLSSLATVHKHLRFMQKKGVIRVHPHKPRGIEIIDEAEFLRLFSAGSGSQERG